MEDLLEWLETASSHTWLQLGPYRAAFEATLDVLRERNLAARLWAHDPSLWAEGTAAQEVSQRLGWLSLPTEMRAEVAHLQEFANQVRADGIERVLLLGMGGSSLAAEVMRLVFGVAEGYPDLAILDTTDPAQIRRIAAEAPLANTLFLVSGKSGTTAETLNLYAYFWHLLGQVVGMERRAAHFVAITDRGTPLEQLGRERSFRAVFDNPPDLGGRFSALSFYGLVPAALIGVDLERLLARAAEMAAACGPDVALESNPGAVLGTALGALAAASEEPRDKLTLLASPELAAYGAWVEQLIAESTGKDGVGILPVEGEFLPSIESYGADRAFVYLRLWGSRSAAIDRRVAQLASPRDATQSQHPVLAMQLRDAYDLGAEFFRWEFATAVAGAVLGVNPFDQPNVEAAKEQARHALARYEETRQLPEQEPVLHEGELAVYGTPLDLSSVPAYLAAFFGLARRGDYVALMAYIDRKPAYQELLEAMRIRIAESLRVAVTVGLGPRFLHSTGQLHKGGPSTGLFLQLTQQESEDLEIPEHAYSFGVLKHAQALGDWEALRHADRRLARVDLGFDVAAGLHQLQTALNDALQPLLLRRPAAHNSAVHTIGSRARTPERTLLLMRHAKSSWQDESLADRDRPLTKRGKKDALAMGDLLLRRGWVPDVILASPAKRARSTARRVAKALSFRGEILHDDRLYSGGLAAFLRALDTLPADAQRVLIVSHNPTLEEAVQHLTGASVHMPTAAVTVVATGAANDLGRLVAVLDPRSTLAALS